MKARLSALIGDGLGLVGVVLGFAALLIAGLLMLAFLIPGMFAAAIVVSSVADGQLYARGWVMAGLILAAISLSVYSITAALRYLGGEDRLSLVWAWCANAAVTAGAGVWYLAWM